MKHIDLHCHLAWDVDDGIRSMDDCRKLLFAAKKDNIEKIVATPHFICGKHNAEHIHILQTRISELKALAQAEGIAIYCGSELYINDMLFHHLKEHTLICIENTPYILCEFSVRKTYDEDYEFMTDYLHELVVAGYTPVLAHVERYFNKRINITAIQELVNMGCIIQMNTSSILYPKNNIMKKNIFDLLDHNLVHVIATDSHNYQGKRSPNMTETFELLSKYYDQANLELLFYKNPLAIITGVQTCTTSFKKHKSFLKKQNTSLWNFFK